MPFVAAALAAFFLLFSFSRGAWALSGKPDHTPRSQFWAEYFDRPGLVKMAAECDVTFPSRQPDCRGFEDRISVDAASAGARRVIAVDSFMARWTGYFFFPAAAEYSFDVQASDGVRLYVDDALAVDSWQRGPARSHSFRKRLCAGWHKIKVKYFSCSASPVLKVSWTPPHMPVFNRFVAEMYNNISWSGEPCAATVESEIFHDFGFGAMEGITGTPSFAGEMSIPTIDYYSIVWTGLFYFDRSAKYRFFLSTDNKGKLYIDKKYVGEADWDISSEKSDYPLGINYGGKHCEYYVGAGTHEMQFVWYEDVGDARAFLKWWRVTPPARPSVSCRETVESPEVELQLSAEDESEDPKNGVSGYYISNSPEAPQATSAGWAAVANAPKKFSAKVPRKLPAPGRHTFFVWFKDSYGNMSDPAGASVDFRDQSPPVVSNVGISHLTRERKNFVEFAVADNIGVAGYLLNLSCDRSPTCDAEWKRPTRPGSESFEATDIVLPDADGTYEIAVVAKDTAGNVSVPATAEIVLDRSRPEVSSFGISKQIVPGEKDLLYFSASDPSGLDACCVCDRSYWLEPPERENPLWKKIPDRAGGTFEVEFEYTRDEQNRSLTLWVADNAGNVSFPSGFVSASGRDGLPVAGHADVRDAGGFVNSLPAAFDLRGVSLDKNISIESFAISFGTTAENEAGGGLRFYAAAPGAGGADFPGERAARTTADGKVYEIELKPLLPEKGIAGEGFFESDGPKRINLWLKYGGGKIAGPYSREFVLDRKAPSGCLVSVAGGAAWTNRETVSVELSASDESGVSSYMISEDPSRPVTGKGSWRGAGGAKNFSSGQISYHLGRYDGEFALHAWFADAAGNIAEATSRLKLDTQAPAAGRPAWRDAGDKTFCPPDSSPIAGCALQPSGTVIVAYADPASGRRVFSKVLAGGKWKDAGPGPLTAGAAGRLEMCQAPSGAYLAATDAAVGYEPQVYEWKDFAWLRIPSFAPGAAVDDMALCAGPDGTIYSAHADPKAGGVTVKKFDGARWTALCENEFRDLVPASKLAFAAARGVQYFAFVPMGRRTPFVAAVSKVPGRDGVRVAPVPEGGGIFSQEAVSISLAGAGNVLYAAVAGRDGSFESRAAAFDGRKWTPLPPLSQAAPGFISDISLALSGGTLMAAFRDHRGDGARIAALKMSGGKWAEAGANPAADPDARGEFRIFAPRSPSGEALCYLLVQPAAEGYGGFLRELSAEKGAALIRADKAGAKPRLFLEAFDDLSGVSAYRLFSPGRPNASAAWTDLAPPSAYFSATVEVPVALAGKGPFAVEYRDAAGNVSQPFDYSDHAGADGAGSVPAVSISSVEVSLREDFSKPCTAEVPLSGAVGLYVRAAVAGSEATLPVELRVSNEDAGEKIAVKMRRDPSDGGRYLGYFKFAYYTKPDYAEIAVLPGQVLSISAACKGAAAAIKVKAAAKWRRILDDNAFSPKAAISTSVMYGTTDSTCFFAYADAENGMKATAVKFVETGRGVISKKAFSEGAATSIASAVYHETVYFAYSDEGFGGRASVATVSCLGKTYEDIFVGRPELAGKWDYLGAPGFTEGPVRHVAFLNYAGTPYIAFQDLARGKRASAMKYNGTNWEYLAPAGFSKGPAERINMHLASDLYVAFQDFGNGGRASVMKYLGDRWEYVGRPGFTEREAPGLSFEFFNTIPYLAFVDTAANGGASVMKYAGEQWEYVGGRNFSDGPVSQLNLVLTDLGVPHVLYTRSDGTIRLSKFFGGRWTDFPAIPQQGRASSPLLYMWQGMPYVLFTDGGAGGATRIYKFE